MGEKLLYSSLSQKSSAHHTWSRRLQIWKISLLSKMSSELPKRSSQAHRNYLDDVESDRFLRCLSLNSGWVLTTILSPGNGVALGLLCSCCNSHGAICSLWAAECLRWLGICEQTTARQIPSSFSVAVRSKAKDHEEAWPLPTKVNLVCSEI